MKTPIYYWWRLHNRHDYKECDIIEKADFIYRTWRFNEFSDRQEGSIFDILSDKLYDILEATFFYLSLILVPLLYFMLALSLG